jgi:hypothetical protein
MSDQAVGWEIEVFRKSDEGLAWLGKLPPGVSHHTLEALLGIDDMSIPAGYPVTTEQVRAVLARFDVSADAHFDVPADAVCPLDDTKFIYFVGEFADTRTTQVDPDPNGASNHE